MKEIYKITYPNGKIYIGKDLTGSINYFGSASSSLIEKDFSRAERKSFTITKELLWESSEASDKEVNAKEVELIRIHQTILPLVIINGPNSKKANEKIWQNDKTFPNRW